MHGIKAFICLPFGLDFQTGQTFTEMAQTVQINLMSHEGGSLHYSRSDEPTVTALTLKTTSPNIRASSGHRLESVSSIKGPGDRHGDPINPCMVSTPAGWLLTPASQTNGVSRGPPCAVDLALPFCTRVHLSFYHCVAQELGWCLVLECPAHETWSLAQS